MGEGGSGSSGTGDFPRVGTIQLGLSTGECG